ncbi:threonine dehydratase [Emydomyces testavorans]|uniref:Threonine dehydratase n=1 Tax=Emydomyces testavorans TaxID=2070801 RepID=A0AAF0DP01_9EURO|nr:threonine dehydratase [Emydomyces testavorans]
MTDPSHWLPLCAANIQAAHARIRPYIHTTPVLTCRTLNRLASTPQSTDTPSEAPPANPKINLFFKCENLQRIGAFKARGAFHALVRLVECYGVDEVRRRGVVTHSSGNHAQALALAASSFAVPAHIVMPRISAPAKIAATTKAHPGVRVVFSGSTSHEREDVVRRVIAETGAILVPPYDHPDVILGQGTVAMELEQQVRELVRADAGLSVHADAGADGGVLDAVITPVGGGGLNAGVATWFAEEEEERGGSVGKRGKRGKVRVFGAEPAWQGADDCRRGLAAGERITAVSSLTVADGLRTPVGEIPWSVISDAEKVRGVYAVTEAQIVAAMRLVLERMKVVVEPSAVVGLAVVLFNEEFRALVEREGGEDGWNVGVVLTGGNTSVEAIGALFAS